MTRRPSTPLSSSLVRLDSSMMGLMSSIPVIRLYLYLRNVFISLESCILLGQGTLHTGLDRRLCGPKQFAMGFPLSTDYVSLSPDDDLGHLLQVISGWGSQPLCRTAQDQPRSHTPALTTESTGIPGSGAVTQWHRHPYSVWAIPRVYIIM